MSNKRGRRSLASVLTVPNPSQIDRIERPPAPHDLGYEEIEIWAAVVNSVAADWFQPENLPLLAQYCRHVVQARRLAEWIVKATSDPEDLDVRDYDRLLKAQARESAAIATLATKMRISQQSTTNHRGNKTAGAGRPKRPWEA